ncbi:hypothetical protein PY254_05845 [Rhodanobacter sp. AS-Z3]|uniref:hypothetical protein n=1 Tax=Rhodanobacter sp. AS-Z3 TaxID=3031330 RepID=UPI002479DB6B|nr:hypothetical protein [Rhodanobacter sp. AS-Z3]WEN16188.1 hypothetical protein PY254_05845 [Rhodanobacter sp. AS-Z3]
MKIKIAFIVGMCLTTSVHANDKPKRFQKEPAKQIGSVVEKCADNPFPVKCQAYQLLHEAQIQIQGSKAMVSLDVFGVEYEHKSLNTVHKSVATQNVELKKSVWPLIDHVQTLALQTNILDDIKIYRDLTIACIGRMDLSKTDVVDDYNSRMDSCNIPAQVQLDKVYVGLGYAAEHPLIGYRKSHWGDSMAEIEAIEGKPDATTDGKLIYQVTLDGHSAFAIFTFIQNKLVSGAYKFNDEHSNKNAFIDDYDSISAVLTTKYGKPNSHDANWSNTLFKSDPSRWGMAVSFGHVNFMEIWFLSDTSITHILGGDNFKVDHIIQYRSIQYKLLIDQEERKHASDEL